jgi:hypothetical protein
MILEKDMLDGTGRKVGMFWLWSWRRRGSGITRATSELSFSVRSMIKLMEAMFIV